MAEGTRRIFDIPRNIYGGMIENVAELKEDIHRIGEELPAGVKKVGTDAKQGVKRGLAFAGKSIREGLELGIGKKDDDGE